MNRKVWLLTLTFVIIFTNIIPSFSYGESQYEKKLEDLIVKSKRLFEITPKYDKFNTNINERQGKTIFNLSWQASEEKNNSINVTAGIDGHIISFSKYSNDYKSSKEKPSKYTREQAQELALDFIERVSPDVKSIKLSKYNEPYNLDDEFYNFIYTRYVNGVEYVDNSININVNKHTGKVTNYYLDWNRDIKFPDIDKSIELKQAKKLFKEEIGLNLIFKINRKNNKPVGIGKDGIDYYLAYSVLKEGIGIDAITGKRINTSYYSPYAEDHDTVKEEALSSGLSPEEQESIDQLKNILNEEEAREKAEQLVDIGVNYKLQNQHIYKSYKNPNEYIWNMYFVSEDDESDAPDVEVSINAKNGELLNFYRSKSYSKKDKMVISKEDALEKANDYLKKQVPDKIERIELVDYNGSYIDLNKSYSFRFMRKEDNIYIEDDSIYIEIDGVNGKVTSYSLDWYNGEFPEVNGIMKIKKAYGILWEKVGLDLVYVNAKDVDSLTEPPQKEDVGVKLAYILNTEKPSIIDARTGDILDYSGEPYKEKLPIKYSDIEDSYASDKIKELAKYGIGLKGKEFLPKQKIKQSEYLYFLWRAVEQNSSQEPNKDELYDYFIKSGYMMEDEKNPEAIVTKVESVKYIIRIMDLEEVAKLNGIYRDVFKDQGKIENGLKGYINIAYGFKILYGDGTGNINPKAELKREDAANIIYNYILK